MSQLLIVLAVALVAAALVFGITVLIMGSDQGLEPVEPDGAWVPLPGSRPLTESDLSEVRFDVALRGYRMSQVDQALRRASYDLGYKEELIGVLEAEVEALRAGKVAEADALRVARERAARPAAFVDSDADPDDSEGSVDIDLEVRAADGDAPAADGGEPAGGTGGGATLEGGQDGTDTPGGATKAARALSAGAGRPGDPAVEPAK